MVPHIRGSPIKRRDDGLVFLSFCKSAARVPPTKGFWRHDGNRASREAFPPRLFEFPLGDAALWTSRWGVCSSPELSAPLGRGCRRPGSGAMPGQAVPVRSCQFGRVASAVSARPCRFGGTVRLCGFGRVGLVVSLRPSRFGQLGRVGSAVSVLPCRFGDVG